MLALFAIFLAGQIVAGWYEFNQEQVEHGRSVIALISYLSMGHPWEALFENWESEFLQMTAFVTLTAVLYQKGSPESRRPGVTELVDANPRDFAYLDDAPWPVKRGGWALRVYEYSLGLALFLLFAISWAGHAIGGWAAYRHRQQLHVLSVAAMVWLAVYLRQRGSPESKPVHASHLETGR
jgi:hypothetical protein